MNPFFLGAFLTISFNIHFLTYGQNISSNSDISWEQAIKTGKGELTVYWFENKPVLYNDQTEGLKGIEYEIIKSFTEFVRDSFKVEVKINWVKEPDFNHVYSDITTKATGLYLGAARISLMEERKKEISFTPPYMADISILLTSNDLPLAKSKDGLIRILQSATAITMKGTSFERDLESIKSDNKITFSKDYRNKGGSEILKSISEEPKTFGYVSLLTYLFNYNQTASNVKRQNYLIKIHDGYALAYPKHSSLAIPLSAYFSGSKFKQSLNKIISNYINLDMYLFMEALASNPDYEIGLLNKEKEIQELQIQIQGAEILRAKSERRFLITVIIVILSLFIVAITLYRSQLKNHHQLKEQKDEIEAQSDEIKSINDNLELTVSQRAKELEMENLTLEKQAFFTAHKLRAPLASVLGLVQLLERVNLRDETKTLITQLKKSSTNLDSVMRRAMNVIEKAESENK